MNEKRGGIQQALPKIKQYCAFQERSHSEVKEKLFALGLNKEEMDPIIARLIEENYLNEQRFAIHFAGGHFRLKQWGKIKIRHALKQKQVSDYCSRKAIQEIDDITYIEVLKSLAEKKLSLLKGEKNVWVKRKKLQDYLLQKGYEPELIREEVAKL